MVWLWSLSLFCGFWDCRFNCLIFVLVLCLVASWVGCRVLVWVGCVLWLWCSLRGCVSGLLVVVLAWFCGFVFGWVLVVCC